MNVQDGRGKNDDVFSLFEFSFELVTGLVGLSRGGWSLAKQPRETLAKGEKVHSSLAVTVGLSSVHIDRTHLDKTFTHP